MKIKIDLESLREHPNMQFIGKKRQPTLTDPAIESLKEKFEKDDKELSTDNRTEFTS